MMTMLEFLWILLAKWQEIVLYARHNTFKMESFKPLQDKYNLYNLYVYNLYIIYIFYIICVYICVCAYIFILNIFIYIYV